mgnify:FL=1
MNGQYTYAISPERIQAHNSHHRKIAWMYSANFFLGMWLAAGSLIFSSTFGKPELNDLACGLLICVFSLLALNPTRLWAPWVLAFTGLWLNIAPVMLWAPQLSTYQNDMLVGILVMTFSIITPGVPGAKLHEAEGPDIPPGWNVNPSSWEQRIPIICLGWFGFFASSYLAAYQLGYIDAVWDPLFGQGTHNVLDSDISKSFPVSDAGLGAFSYMLDAMMGYIGGVNRWRTMPWAVILFGILIIPLGAVSITLIILQPTVVGAWCFMCLLTAIAMLVMIPCAFDEVIASVMFLKQSKKSGQPFWQAFWHGGSIPGAEPQKEEAVMPPGTIFRNIFSGMSIPWNLVVTSLAGIWLMLSPAALGYNNALADSDHTAGALIITFSVIAMGEVSRAARFFNIVLGAWIIIAPIALGFPSFVSLVNEILCGLILILLSFRKGRVVNDYGAYNRFII